MRAFDRDLIRGGHYGQRSLWTAQTGRTHGCTDQPATWWIFLPTWSRPHMAQRGPRWNA